MAIYLLIVLLRFHWIMASAKLDCGVGTCYSGRLFPEPQDIFHGWHLKGFSYKNITTDNPSKCYSSCTQDCRCKACQMKDARCELLDEDNTSKNESFVEESGYVYYDLKQTMYQGKSHMLPPGVCQNGCCRSQPCLNGGTCIEHCDSPKEKFSCNCTYLFRGKLCEEPLEPRSCLEVLESFKIGNNMPSDGNYTIIDHRNRSRTTYCSFEKPNRAWTLIESFSISNKQYHQRAFHQGGKQGTIRNRKKPNWVDFFETRLYISYISRTSSMFRVTCDFPYRSTLLPDYLFGYISDYDIINYGDVTARCFKFAHINIRDFDFFNTTASVTQVQDKFHFFIDGHTKTCGLQVPGSSPNERNFGDYTPLVKTTVCTGRENSTTQYWLGEEVIR